MFYTSRLNINSLEFNFVYNCITNNTFSYLNSRKQYWCIDRLWVGSLHFYLKSTLHNFLTSQWRQFLVACCVLKCIFWIEIASYLTVLILTQTQCFDRKKAEGPALAWHLNIVNRWSVFSTFVFIVQWCLRSQDVFIHAWYW